MVDERFRISLNRAFQSLLPYARANRMTPDKWETEFREHHNKMNPQRVFHFDPYRVILSIEENGIALASISAKLRRLSEDEKAAFIEVFADTFPDLSVDRVDGVALPGSAAFKIFGLPKPKPE